METEQPIAGNNRLDSSSIAPRTRGDKANLHREILLEMCFRQRFERSLENKISRQRKSSEFETIRTRIQLIDVIRFHIIMIKFGYNARCYWLKERAL